MMYLHPPVQDGENIKAKHQEIKSPLQKCCFNVTFTLYEETTFNSLSIQQMDHVVQCSKNYTRKKKRCNVNY